MSRAGESELDQCDLKRTLQLVASSLQGNSSSLLLYSMSLKITAEAIAKMRHNHASKPTRLEAAFGRMINLWPGITPPTRFQDILWDAVAACLILCVSTVSIIAGTVLDQWLNLGLLEMRVDIWSLPIAIGVFVISVSAMLALVQMLIVGIPASLIRGLRLLAKSLRGWIR